MGNNIYDDVAETARRTMVLFFVVDCSGSMSGAKMGTVNSAIEEIVPEIKSISETNADARIKVAVLKFATTAEWLYSAPVEAESFVWQYLDANGMTALGEACRQLNEKLSRKEFMSDATGSYAPAIFLLSDGEPTDDYERSLKKLKENNWFKKAIKVALAIGDEANQQKLAEFTGTGEAVITVHTPEALRSWIRFVSVRSSEIGSKSAAAGTKAGDSETPIVTKQEQLVEAIKEEKEAEEGGIAQPADSQTDGGAMNWDDYKNDKWD